MSKEMPIKFIQQKIQELQTAIFFPETSSTVKIPNHIITPAQTDEEGQIWFIVRRPVLYIEQSDEEFPCRLDFFKKGIGFHMKVYGKASILSDFEGISCPIVSPGLKQRMETNQAVVIKMKIRYADYFEIQPEHTNNPVQDHSNYFINWLFKTPYMQRSHRLIRALQAPQAFSVTL